MNTYLKRNKVKIYFTFLIFAGFLNLTWGWFSDRLFLNTSIEKLNLISAESSVFVAVNPCTNIKCALPLSKESISKLDAAIKLASNGERFYRTRGTCELILQAKEGDYHYFLEYIGNRIVIHPIKRLSAQTLVKYVSASNYKTRQLLILPDFLPKSVGIRSCKII